jgi:glycogen operon protein
MFCLLTTETDGSISERQIELSRLVQGVYYANVPQVSVGDHYGFRVSGEWDPQSGLRFNPHKILLDPYSKRIAGTLIQTPAIYDHSPHDPLVMSTTENNNHVPHSVVTASHFDWEGDRPPNIPWSETVIYEAHVKGLTQLHPSVPETDRGTFRGVTAPALIEHLRHIGVTAIELLPVQSFLSEPHLMDTGLSNYWGYNTIGFFAPHAQYASGPGTEIEDFKYMVRELHRSGIEVILDVVYNHTAEGGAQGPFLCFKGINNLDFYRLSDSGDYIDVTGCGNSVNASLPQALQVIMDSLRYWVTEMHVDGFRFDLATALTRGNFETDMHGAFLNTIQQDPVLRKVKLIAEPWDVGPDGYHLGSFPSLWSEWNDRYRDDVRDFWRGESGIEHIGWRLTGSEDINGGKSADPCTSINFVTSHDGFTLLDLVSYNHKHNQANLEDNRDGTDNNRSDNYGVEGPTHDLEIQETRARQIRNFMTTMYLSSGVPMLVAGDEFHRTQLGNNNGYCQDNSISWVNWEIEQSHWDLIDLCATLNHIRTVWADIRPPGFFTGAPHCEGGPKDLAWVGPDGCEIEDWGSGNVSTVGMFISPAQGDSLLCIFHAGTESIDFVLPSNPYDGYSYTPILDTTFTNGTPNKARYESDQSVSLTPRSTLILQARKSST